MPIANASKTTITLVNFMGLLLFKIGLNILLCDESFWYLNLLTDHRKIEIS